MADPRFTDLVYRLVSARIADRREQLPLDISTLRAEFAKNGQLGSGRYLVYVHQAITRELEIRAVIVWESLVRVHQTLDTPLHDDLAAELKEQFVRYLEQFASELSGALAEHIKDGKLRERLTISEAQDKVRKKHDVEIDLYVESLRQREALAKKGGSMSQNYTFYGNVGAVQTGANANANIVQSLSDEDRQALLEALGQVREVVTSAEQLGAQRKELQEVTDDAAAIVRSADPNSTKLRAYLDVLSAAVQGIAGAQPAYQALKAALLPLGIMLPVRGQIPCRNTPKLSCRHRQRTRRSPQPRCKTRMHNP
ncbi:MAG: hypothetical protein Q8S05_09035 [Sulfuricella sp.]|nr:hypothetical protein [Sulfuricella sp.]